MPRCEDYPCCGHGPAPWVELTDAERAALELCSGRGLARVGRIWTWDEGHGGAYYVEGRALCWAPLEAAGLDWEQGVQVDGRDLLSGDPGWDYARWAESALIHAEDATREARSVRWMDAH